MLCIRRQERVMRQPDQVGPDGNPRYPLALQPAGQETNPVSPVRDRRAPRRSLRRSNPSGMRAILAIVLVLLVAMLAYLLTLSSKPSITNLKPMPGSSADAGVVLVEARVTAAKPIEHVTLTIDGVTEIPAVVTEGDRSWVVRFQSVLPVGTHQARVIVRDSSGKERHQSWSFSSAGPRVAPTIIFSDPPTGATLPQGIVRIGAQIGSDSAISAAMLTIDGQQIPIVTSPADVPAQPGASDATGAPRMNIVAERSFAAGTHVAHVTASDSQGDTTNSDWSFTVAADPADATARYFSSTKRYIAGPFKTFWEAHDGHDLFGDPISSEFVDERGTSVQYFQRARFERGENNKVHLGLLGVEALGSTQEKVDKPAGFSGRYFSATGHTLAGKFQDYWTENGGLEMFGYPISEVIDQNGTKVQYFERARFELREGDNGKTTVELTPLGQQIWNTRQNATSG
jgi:hypothetical protein